MGHRYVGIDIGAETIKVAEVVVEGERTVVGRRAIVELIRMSDGLRRLVMQHATSGEIQDKAVEEGMRTMYFDGLNKCLEGVTTLDEVLRVTQEA